MGSCEATLQLIASDDVIRRGETVTIEVYLSSSSAFRAYQVALRVSGGSAGTLTLEDVTIDGVRSDFLFHGEAFVTAVNETFGRAAGALFEGGVPAASAKYLATLTFRATQDAGGAFTVDVDAAETLLRDDGLAECLWEFDAPITITIKGS